MMDLWLFSGMKLRTKFDTIENRYELNKNLAQMLKGGVIMDVTTPEQAKIAEKAGACAVMALERILKKSTFVQSKNTLNLSSCTSNC